MNSSKLPTYKNIRKMLEEVDSGKQFARGLIGRCFVEASFDDLEQILEKQSPNTNAKVRTLSLYKRYPLAVAASISLILVAAFIGFRLVIPNTFQTAYGENKQIELPDNSLVTLNANSSVKYNPISWYWNRSLEMKGEAFFDVEKGSTFTVNTENGKVEVLGTSFNVEDRNNKYAVYCKTGKVSVNYGQDQVILEPQEKVELLNNALVKSTADKEEDKLAWKSGYFYFDASNLNEIALELENQYGINVVLDTKEEYLFTGTFPIKNSINSLETVCSALGLKYKASDVNESNHIIIYE